MTIPRSLLPFVACVAVLLTAPAHAESQNPYLQAGIDLYLDFEYEAALEQLKKAAGVEGNARFDKIQISLWLGYIRMELGDEEGAREDFKAALTLDPKLDPPDNSSPKVKIVFEQARELVRKARPATPVVTPPAITEAPPAGVVPPPPPPPPVAPAQTDAPQAPRPAVADRPAASDGGSSTRTLVAGVEAVPSEALDGQAPGTVDTFTRPSRVLAYVLVGAGVVLAGSGAYFGLQSSRSATGAEDAHFQSDASTQLDSARGQALTANVLYGVAGAAVIGGVVSFFSGGDATPARSSAAAQSPVDPAARSSATEAPAATPVPAPSEPAERDPFD